MSTSTIFGATRAMIESTVEEMLRNNGGRIDQYIVCQFGSIQDLPVLMDAYNPKQISCFISIPELQNGAQDDITGAQLCQVRFNLIQRFMIVHQNMLGISGQRKSLESVEEPIIDEIVRRFSGDYVGSFTMPHNVSLDYTTLQSIQYSHGLPNQLNYSAIFAEINIGVYGNLQKL